MALLGRGGGRGLWKLPSGTGGSVNGWPDLDCGIPDYIEGRPVVLNASGELQVAEMVLTETSRCRITTVSGDTVYAGTPYVP